MEEETSRTEVVTRGEFDELNVEGLADGAVAIDHAGEQPRIIMQVESFDDIIETVDEGAYIVVAASPMTDDRFDAVFE